MVGCGYGEKPPPSPELKVRYTQSDKFTIQSFDVIRENYEAYLKGRLKNTGFHEAIDRALVLILKGSDRAVGRKKNVYTQEELKVLFSSGILDESPKIRIWIKRIVAITNILLGEKKDQILVSEVEEIFRRIHIAAPHVIELSDKNYELSRLERLHPMNQERYWQLRKDVFVSLLKIVTILLQNDKGVFETPIVKEVILDQYPFVAEDLNLKEWRPYIDAAFLVNHIILGRSKTHILPEHFKTILEVIDSSYQKIFDIYAIYEKNIWSTKEYVGIVQNYIEILNKFLEVFYYQQIVHKITSEDLTTLFELLHFKSHVQAKTFVSSLIELKNLMFQKGSTQFFNKEETQKIRDLFGDALEYAYIETQKESPTHRINHLWKTPFDGKPEIKVHDRKFSFLLLHFIDQLIARYDQQEKESKKFDGKLSLTFPNNNNESEVILFTQMVKKMILGFRQMVANQETITIFEKIDDQVLAKALVYISDNLFKNSNHDQSLDRFEILEILNFIIENERFINLLSKSFVLKRFQHQLGNTWEYGRISFIQYLPSEPEMETYFPKFIDSFQTKEEFSTFLVSFMHVLGTENEEMITVNELRLLFGFIRLMEHLFLAYDKNKNQQLDKHEILFLFHHFENAMDEMIQYFKNTADQKERTKIMPGLFDMITTGKQRITKNIIFYMITHGEFPQEYPGDLDKQPKQSATRTDIMKLLEKLIPPAATLNK